MSEQVVVITGSTRGIGLGLADAFAGLGCRVVVSGRTAGAVEGALAGLSSRHDPGRLTGHPCDVARRDQVEALWAAAERAFGGVDLWINNAGVCNAQLPFVELPASDIDAVVGANVLGTMHGAQVAMARMLAQGRGQIFNMEGWGSRGEWLPGMTLYSSTKLALRSFSDGLSREARGSPVRVGTMSPGMVATDALIQAYQGGDPANWRRMRWLFKFVIDPPELVCGWLARRALANRKNGAHLTWMTPWRLALRFLQPSYYMRNPVAGTPLDGLG
jgi:NAD(P)-dependent dehydrogenase (short-subunit alcohol dehydrogenase family)